MLLNIFESLQTVLKESKFQLAFNFHAQGLYINFMFHLVISLQGILVRAALVQ